MNKKNCILLVVVCVIFSSISLIGSEEGSRSTRGHKNKRKCEQILFPFLNKKREAINKQQKTIDKEQKKNTSEIITALDAYFDKLSLDDQKEPDIDLVIPNLPIAIIATQEKEEIVVDVKKK